MFLAACWSPKSWSPCVWGPISSLTSGGDVGGSHACEKGAPGGGGSICTSRPAQLNASKASSKITQMVDDPDIMRGARDARAGLGGLSRLVVARILAAVRELSCTAPDEGEWMV